MSIKYLLFVGICLGIARQVYTVDLTLKPGETSDAVIDATIRKIRTKCILADDYYFLRRLASSQMKSIAATTGGIWRVTKTQLTTVQNDCNATIVNCSKVETDFNIDVSTLTMSDLQIPLYSGLVMSLFILNLNTPISVTNQLQANYWVQYINSNGSTNVFIDCAKKLEQKNECASAQIDLVFVIDSSGSVGSGNFAKTKTFLNNVVSKLDISPNEARVAVIRFSTSPVVSFGLGTYGTKNAVEKAINSISYNGGGTATDIALDKARTDVFTNARKSAASKVLVLVTDGKSNSEARTVAAAKKLKDEGVIIFTIGVVNPRKSELLAAASEPSCTHFINLKDYNEIGFIVREIESKSCKAPIIVPPDTQIVNNTIPQTNETKEQVLEITNTTESTLGTTILVRVQCGVVILYASFVNSYPTEADYDYKTYATDDQPGKLFLVQQSELDKLVLTVQSQKRFDLNSSACDNPSYDLSINPTAPRIEAACLVKHVHRQCTPKQYDSACYNTTPVVSEVSQLYNTSIPMNDKIQEQVLEISNSTDSSGSIILVSAQCAEVTVYGAFNNKYPFEDDHDYKTSATDNNTGEIILSRNSEADHLTLTIFSRRQRGFNSSACDHPSYSVNIKPKHPKHKVSCHRKQDERPCTSAESNSKCYEAPRIEAACLVKRVNSQCPAEQYGSACYNTSPVVGEVSKLYNSNIPKNGRMQERVLEISNSTDSSGSIIQVSAQCAEVTVYGAFNNKYPFKDDHDYKTSATHNNPGKIIVSRKSKADQLTLTIFSKRQRGLNSSACRHPSYTVSIKPNEPMFEVSCHRKQDEIPCTSKESDSKCYEDPKDGAATNQLSITAWISAGLLLTVCATVNV